MANPSNPARPSSSPADLPSHGQPTSPVYYPASVGYSPPSTGSDMSEPDLLDMSDTTAIMDDTDDSVQAVRVLVPSPMGGSGQRSAVGVQHGPAFVEHATPTLPDIRTNLPSHSGATHRPSYPASARSSSTHSVSARTVRAVLRAPSGLGGPAPEDQHAMGPTFPGHADLLAPSPSPAPSSYPTAAATAYAADEDPEPGLSDAGSLYGEGARSSSAAGYISDATLSPANPGTTISPSSDPSVIPKPNSDTSATTSPTSDSAGLRPLRSPSPHADPNHADTNTPTIRELNLQELLSSLSTSPSSSDPSPQGPVPDEEGGLDEALNEVHLLIESYGALREQVAATSGSVEETTERIIDALRKHKCPEATVSSARREALAKAEARVVRYKRHADGLAARAQLAEARTREAETAALRLAADAERLKKKLNQGNEDLKTSERHGEMITRKLAEAIENLAAVQVENDELRSSHSKLKKTQASRPSFVLVLLEGEGRMFDPKLLARGADGGLRFVEGLQAEARRLFEMMNLGTCGQIHIHLYMDLAVTFRDLRRAGFITSDKQFEDFLESMGECDRLCTVVDVPGKFGASHKIRAQMASFGMLDSCGMVFIAAANDRKYLDEVGDWKRKGACVVDKLFAARSTIDRRDDPFLALGDDRLFAVQSLFPTSPAEWARLMEPPQRPERDFGNRGLLMEPTGATTAQALPPAIQPNPALVPNYVAHAHVQHRDGSGATPATYRDQVGSPIPFTPMPTGVRYPDRGRGPSPPPPPMPRAAPAGPRHAAPHREPPPPSAPRVANPPWQQFRAASSQSALPEMLRRSVASGTATPPRRLPEGIAFRKGLRSPSIGGSPPSTDEDNPLDPTIPAVARTHVERPPRFGGHSSSTGGSAIGAPPAGFRVRGGGW